MVAVDEKLIRQRKRKIARALNASCTDYRQHFTLDCFAPSLLRGENWSLGSVDQSGNTLKYDAWNRLISVTNSSGQIIAQYSYDARGYRVSETYPQGGSGVPAGTTNYIYYDSNWQAIEIRTNGTAASDVTSQTVWSAAYVNSPVLQDSFSGGVIQPNSRIYFLHDANWNTTAVVGYNATTQTWDVTQRYIYSPYGSVIVLDADFSAPPAGTQPISDYLYQGMTLDAVTGLYYARNRNYSPSLGVWISQDPLQYVNGADTYQMEMSGPVGAVDPSGLGRVGNYPPSPPNMHPQPPGPERHYLQQPQVPVGNVNDLAISFGDSEYLGFGGGWEVTFEPKDINGGTEYDLTLNLHEGIGIGGDVEIFGQKFSLESLGPSLQQVVKLKVFIPCGKTNWTANLSNNQRISDTFSGSISAYAGVEGSIGVWGELQEKFTLTGTHPLTLTGVFNLKGKIEAGLTFILGPYRYSPKDLSLDKSGTFLLFKAGPVTLAS